MIFIVLVFASLSFQQFVESVYLRVSFNDDDDAYTF
jgi:hypothetical protein